MLTLTTPIQYSRISIEIWEEGGQVARSNELISLDTRSLPIISAEELSNVAQSLSITVPCNDISLSPSIKSDSFDSSSLGDTSGRTVGGAIKVGVQGFI